jgi:hypothetical protein
MQALTISRIIDSIENDFNAETSCKRIPKPNDDNWQDVIELLKIDPKSIYEESPVCIEINGADGYSRFASLGNFTAVIGKAKSRKTFFIAYLLSFILKGSDLGDKIRITLPTDKRNCILFDTEQANYDISVLVKRIYNTAQIGFTEDFEAYGLRVLTPADRLFIIEKKLYETKNLGTVVIDGIRDLISDINNADEGTMITSKLLKWTQELNIHIIVVLHQNKADTNARGHLGTEIINKAEGVISIAKEEHLSIVKSEFCRVKDFAPFAFSISDAGLPYVIDGWVDKAKKENKKSMEPSEVPKETHWDIIRKVLPVGRQLNRKELERELSQEFKGISIGLTNAQVCQFINYYKNNLFLKDTGGKGRVGNRFFINQSEMNK